MPKNCRSNEMIHRYIDGELSKKETERFEKQLSDDTILQTTVSFYNKLLKDLKAFSRVKFSSGRIRSTRAALIKRVEAMP